MISYISVVISERDTMNGQKTKSNENNILRIHYAVTDLIEETKKNTFKDNAIIQNRITLPENIEINAESESEYSEYDDHDEGVWYSDPED